MGKLVKKVTSVQIDDGERRILPLDGCIISQVCFGWLVTLRMECPGTWYELQVEAPFVLATNAADSVTIDPEGTPGMLAPLLDLLRKSVICAVAFNDGRLELTITDSYEMRIPGGDKYESWMLTGSDGLRIVSMPDAQLAVWRPRPVSDQATGK